MVMVVDTGAMVTMLRGSVNGDNGHDGCSVVSGDLRVVVKVLRVMMVGVGGGDGGIFFFF